MWRQQTWRRHSVGLCSSSLRAALALASCLIAAAGCGPSAEQTAEKAAEQAARRVKARETVRQRLRIDAMNDYKDRNPRIAVSDFTITDRVLEERGPGFTATLVYDVRHTVLGITNTTTHHVQLDYAADGSFVRAHGYRTINDLDLRLE